MILSASCGTSVVAATCLDALDAPFGASEVWQGERVLRDVRSCVIVAKAAVAKSVLENESQHSVEPGYYFIASCGLTASQVLTLAPLEPMSSHMRGHVAISL